MDPLETLDLVYKYGALPLLMFAVKVLWGKVDIHESSIKELNADQKKDLRNHADEVKSLHQNTLTTINALSDKIKE